VWRVARRPKWIAALVLALVVAGVFAALGHGATRECGGSAVSDHHQCQWAHGERGV
jgi:hypothetical protein